MKAFNKRKLPREHRLFLTKCKKLSFTTITDSDVIRVYRKDGVKYLQGKKLGTFYEQFMKLVKENGKNYRIKFIEDRHNVKIEDIGLSRRDFTVKNHDMNKIYRALERYFSNEE